MAIDIGGETQLLGLLGWPVAHSLSPAMHNAAAADLGLDIAYLPLSVHPDQLAPAVHGLAALGFRGANVTVPHKEAIIPLLDQIDPATAAIGAVNTVVISGQWAVGSDQPSAFSSQLSDSSHQQPTTSDQQPATSAQPSSFNLHPSTFGFNTDWSGFLADLQTLEIEVRDRDCLILGAGGSARAVAYGLATAGSRVHLFARRVEQARQIVAGLEEHCPAGSLAAHNWTALQDEYSRFAAAALVINTTPVGMAPHVSASPWPDGVPLPEKAFIYDLVYNPAETKLMHQARAAGHSASNGLGMLLHQGALAFKLWTGLDPDLKVMAQALQANP
jgi:shikimate dehydrogenase